MAAAITKNDKTESLSLKKLHYPFWKIQEKYEKFI